MFRLTSITNTPSASPAVSYAYTYDQANQRTQVVREDGTYWSYGYNAKGEVIRGQKKLATGDLLNGYDYAYDYDDIGNRKSTTTNGQAAAYTPNLLNQYTQRSVPGVVDVFGTADPAAIVTVNYAATTRQGAYFYAQPTVDNASLPKYSTLTVYGVKHNVDPNGEDAVSNTTRTAFTARTPEPFTYDDDGNLISDGHWTYAWDAENRLIGMQTQPAAAAAGAPNLMLEFAYDASGRRVQKTVATWNGSAFAPTSDTRFLYDGWNLQAEFAGTADMPALSYVWGLDLSGSLQGAGGVAGLLADATDAVVSLAAFDAHGNVTSLVNAANGSDAVDSEYDPFGNLVKPGASAGTCRFGFSSKYYDAEMGLSYFGRRFYDPLLAQWLSRDDIVELGGVNLYKFAAGAPLSNFDLLGNRVEPFTADVNSILLVPSMKLPTMGSSELGEAGITWSVSVSGSGSRVQVTGELGIHPVYFHSATVMPGLISRDRLGNSTDDHEHHHDSIAVEAWNKFARFANDLEGHYECEKCGELARAIVSDLSDYYLYSSSIKQFTFDLDAYAKGSKDEAYYIKQKNYFSVASSKALEDEKALFGTFSALECKLKP